jgi:hypothetical protein
MIAGIGVAAVAAATGNRPTALAAVMIIMGVNDCATSATAECQGTTLSLRHYRRMNTLANSLRRLGNTATAFSGPVLFAIAPQLPFLLFGGIMVGWAALLVAAFHVRARQVWRVLQQNQQRRRVVHPSSAHRLHGVNSWENVENGHGRVDAYTGASFGNEPSKGRKGGLGLYWHTAPFIELECSYHVVAESKKPGAC